MLYACGSTSFCCIVFEILLHSQDERSFPSISTGFTRTMFTSMPFDGFVFGSRRVMFFKKAHTFPSIKNRTVTVAAEWLWSRSTVQRSFIGSIQMILKPGSRQIQITELWTICMIYTTCEKPVLRLVYLTYVAHKDRWFDQQNHRGETGCAVFKNGFPAARRLRTHQLPVSSARHRVGWEGTFRAF